jgi:hypothetical protein
MSKTRSAAVAAVAAAAAALAATGITYASAASESGTQPAPATQQAARAAQAPVDANNNGNGNNNGNNGNEGKGNEGKGNEGRHEERRHEERRHHEEEGRIFINERSYSAHAGSCITVVSGLGAKTLNIRNDTRHRVEVFRGAVCDNGAPVATVGPHSSSEGVKVKRVKDGVKVDDGVVASFWVVERHHEEGGRDRDRDRDRDRGDDRY